MTAAVPSTAPAQPASPLDLDGIEAVLAHPLQNRPWRDIVRSLVAEVRRLRAELDATRAVGEKLRRAMVGQHDAAGHALAVHAQGEDCSWCIRAADECDGAYACEDWKAWQAEYEAALALPLDAAPAAPATTPTGVREDVAYLVYRAVDIADPSRAAALEVADQILTRLGAGPLSSVPPAGTEGDDA